MSNPCTRRAVPVRGTLSLGMYIDIILQHDLRSVSLPYHAVLEEVTAKFNTRALVEANGNVSAAARTLGMRRDELRYAITKHKLRSYVQHRGRRARSIL